MGPIVGAVAAVAATINSKGTSAVRVMVSQAASLRGTNAAIAGISAALAASNATKATAGTATTAAEASAAMEASVATDAPRVGLLPLAVKRCQPFRFETH
jgi:hypothetical protein